MKTALKSRIIVLFLTIFTLSVAFTMSVIWFNSIYQQNAMVLGLANRQQSLLREMTTNALELPENSPDQEQHIARIQEAAHLFEQTLMVLSSGGHVPNLQNQLVELTPSQNPDVTARLHAVHHTWDIFRGYLEVLVATDPNSPDFNQTIQAIEQLSPILTQESNEVVELYQAALVQKRVWLNWLQGGFVAGILGLLVLVYLIRRKNFTVPLEMLGAVAERIVQGDLNTPAEISGPREIEAIAHSMDVMRMQLKNSQNKLLDRTEKLKADLVQRDYELNVAFEVSQNIVNALDLKQFLTSITDRAKTLTRAQTVRLCLAEDNSKDMVLAASSGDFPISTGPPQTPNGRSEIQLINIGESTPIDLPCAQCSFPKNSQSKHCLITPLRVGERLIGGLCVVRTEPQPFDLDEIRALALLANSAAIAMSNAWLVESSRLQAEQAASLIERDRLAANLHDHLAQTLGHLNFKVNSLGKSLQSAGFTADTASQLDLIRTELNNAYAQVRTALTDLQQPEIPANSFDTTRLNGTQKTLAEELESCLSDFENVASLPVHLDVIDSAVLALPLNLRFQALSIIREALINARRHAQAQQVGIHVEQAAGGNEICFTIEDDGRGFNLDTMERGNHYGLSIMRARAERSGGRFQVDSTPGAGTKIRAYFPLLTSNRHSM